MKRFCVRAIVIPHAELTVDPANRYRGCHVVAAAGFLRLDESSHRVRQEPTPGRMFASYCRPQTESLSEDFAQQLSGQPLGRLPVPRPFGRWK